MRNPCECLLGSSLAGTLCDPCNCIISLIYFIIISRFCKGGVTKKTIQQGQEAIDQTMINPAVQIMHHCSHLKSHLLYKLFVFVNKCIHATEYFNFAIIFLFIEMQLFHICMEDHAFSWTVPNTQNTINTASGCQSLSGQNLCPAPTAGSLRGGPPTMWKCPVD